MKAGNRRSMAKPVEYLSAVGVGVEYLSVLLRGSLFSFFEKYQKKIPGLITVFSAN
jgi:hypothetical protein